MCLTVPVLIIIWCVFCCSLCAYSHTEIEMLCVVLTQRCQVSILGAEQEEIHSYLLTGAVQCQFLVEVCGRAEVLNSLNKGKKNLQTHHQIIKSQKK